MLMPFVHSFAPTVILQMDIVSNHNFHKNIEVPVMYNSVHSHYGNRSWVDAAAAEAAVAGADINSDRVPY